jgi:hypothetical protein
MLRDELLHKIEGLQSVTNGSSSPISGSPDVAPR